MPATPEAPEIDALHTVRAAVTALIGGDSDLMEELLLAHEGEQVLVAGVAIGYISGLLSGIATSRGTTVDKVWAEAIGRTM